MKYLETKVAHAEKGCGSYEDKNIFRKFLFISELLRLYTHLNDKFDQT